MAKGQTKQAQVQPALPTPTAHRPPPQAPCAPPTARLSSSRSSPPAAAALRALRALPERLLCVCLPSMIQPPSFHGVISIFRPVLMLLCMLLALGLCASG